ncbi:unnamed protein product [Clonostachys chloroleuca]|uniref:Uncharacterized protein n=1 Tax=Clonostachys chloroleuca TaxID=1926264 RepID=A0AA35QCJ0_9HYPO|nr:unnamed protein product [Clonostachys chloroleuca]
MGVRPLVPVDICWDSPDRKLDALKLGPLETPGFVKHGGGKGSELSSQEGWNGPTPAKCSDVD